MENSNETQYLESVLQSSIEKVVGRGPFPKCGGCGVETGLASLGLVNDKKGNHGYLCATCAPKYRQLLQPNSSRNFWMCGVCGFRVLAGTAIDATVDENGNQCPNCHSDVNLSLVNLSQDEPIGRGLIGEPVG